MGILGAWINDFEFCQNGSLSLVKLAVNFKAK